MRKLVTLVAVAALILLPFAPSASAAWPTNDACSPLWEKGQQ